MYICLCYRRGAAQLCGRLVDRRDEAGIEDVAVGTWPKFQGVGTGCL